jgi:MHS family proline/betaine transporter-like MFS transporter
MAKFNKKVYLGLFLANILEHYIFVLYPLLMPYIKANFFNDSNEVIAFLLFALGYALRPVSGIVFGMLSDKYSRNTIALIILPISGAMGIIISILPVTLFGAFGLAFARLIHGFSHSGFMPIALTYILEQAKKDSFSVGLLYSGAAIGSILANGTTLFLEFILPNESMYSYGWRLPYIGALFLVIISFYLKNKIPEISRSSKSDSYKNIFVHLKKKSSSLFAAFLMSLPASSMVMISLSFPSSLTQHFGFDHFQSMSYSFLGSVFYGCIIIIAGYYARSKHKQYLFGLFSVILTGFLFMHLSKNYALIGLLFIRFNLAIIGVVYTIYISRQFSEAVRNTALGFSYSTAFFMSSLLPSALHYSNNYLFDIGKILFISATLGLIGYVYLSSFKKSSLV